LTRSIDTGAFALSRPLSAAIAWAAGKGEGRLDTNVRELTVITLISLFSLGLAWGHEADLFAMFLRQQQRSPRSRRFDDPCEHARGSPGEFPYVVSRSEDIDRK